MRCHTNSKMGFPYLYSFDLREAAKQRGRCGGSKKSWHLPPSTLAAIDVQDFPRNEGCRIQEQNSVGDIAGLAHAAQRMERIEHFVIFRRVHWSLDDPRRNGIPANAFFRVLNRQ